jgi:hypothetical protein
MAASVVVLGYVYRDGRVSGIILLSTSTMANDKDALLGMGFDVARVECQ